MVLSNSFSNFIILIVATIGNTIGSLTTYWLGHIGNWKKICKWVRIQPEEAEKYIKYATRYGAWFGLLVWCPIIGDVFALCMGLVKCNVWYSSLAILLGKLLRYALVIYIFM